MSAWSHKRGDLDVEAIGPFSTYELVVNGWTVPGVSSYRVDVRTVAFVCGSYAYDIPEERAGAFADWLANVVAVSMGWTCHPSASWNPPDAAPFRSLPWHRAIRLNEIPNAETSDE